MMLPKTPALPALTAGLLLLASTALGQGVEFGVIDTNSDGYLSQVELEATFGSEGASLLDKDRNDDGVLSRDELSATQEGEEEDEAEEELGDEANEDNPRLPEDTDGDGNRGHGDNADRLDTGNPGLLHRRDRDSEDGESRGHGRGRSDDAGAESGSGESQGRGRGRGRGDDSHE